MGDETLVVVDEASGVDDERIAAVMEAPIGWTRAWLVKALDFELSTVLGTLDLDEKLLPTLSRVLTLRDAALEMLHAGTHDGECLHNASGACILHLRMFRVRQAKLAQALGYGETCSMCRGSRLVTTLPGAEAWSEWEAWLRDASDEDRAAMGHVRAIPCPVCSSC